MHQSQKTRYVELPAADLVAGDDPVSNVAGYYFIGCGLAAVLFHHAFAGASSIDHGVSHHA